MRTRTVLHALCRSFSSLAVLIDRAGSEHKRRRREGTRLSRSRKPVTTLRGITWETSDTTPVSMTGRKAQNGQDDSSSVGCSPECFLRLAKAENRDTDFPPPSQLSVPFAVVETANSPPVGGVSPRCREKNNTGLPCISHSRKTKLVLRERASSGPFCFCLPSSSYRVRRFLCLFAIDVILRFSGVTLFHWGGVSLESINQPIILTCFFLFEMCHRTSPPQVTCDASGTAKKHAHARG